MISANKVYGKIIFKEWEKSLIAAWLELWPMLLMLVIWPLVGLFYVIYIINQCIFHSPDFMKMPDLMSRITCLLCGYCKLISF